MDEKFQLDGGCKGPTLEINCFHGLSTSSMKRFSENPSGLPVILKESPGHSTQEILSE
jgi:hypothetical protein